MSIIVMKKGSGAKKVGATPVTQEVYLQEYIHDNPGVIPLDDIREDIRLFVFAREFPTPSGSIDALAIDDEGAIYIIETKLYKNPDKRLVVAQVLDYGAGLWNSFGDFSEIEHIIDQSVSQEFGMSFRQKLIDFFGIDDEQVSIVLNRFKSDLSSGQFTFIVLMDHIHDRLKDLITFINANSRFVLLGCETEFYRYEDLEILIPKLYGTEIKKPIPSSSKPASRKKWDERTFFEDIRNRLEPPIEKKIRELYEYAQRTADNISWGTGASRGSFNPKYKKISVRSLFTVFSDGVLQVNFEWLNDNESTLEFRKKLKDALADKAGLIFPPDYEEKQITFQAPQWYERVADIIEVLDGLIGEASNKVDTGNA
ncbi:hypothetical protein ISS30_02560 [bacterium]|nr:hypothetical protein [bacterium]